MYVIEILDGEEDALEWAQWGEELFDSAELAIMYAQQHIGDSWPWRVMLAGVES